MPGTEHRKQAGAGAEATAAAGAAAATALPPDPLRDPAKAQAAAPPVARPEDPGGSAASVVVLDTGKSNVKLVACSADGAVIETLSIPNPVLPGPPWRHHDLKALNQWALSGLAALARRHPIRHFIATGHGVGGVLAGADPDQNGDGLALPMIDYEQPLPAGLAESYAPQAGDFHDRGSAFMLGATHIARQVYWAETHQPSAFKDIRWIMGIPQYWAWRLSGVAASEASYLGAQSHLWNVVKGCWSPIVTARNWQKMMPELRAAGADLGPIRPALAAAYGIPQGIRIHTGGHDSSLSFYRYQASGLRDFMVLSTGTWIVGLADHIDPADLDEQLGMTLNADVFGVPTGGALVMGGREYAAVAGPQPEEARTDPVLLARLIAQGTMALPAFGENDGQFPGRKGQGKILGPAPKTAAERQALAVLYVALLAHRCGMALAPNRPWVLDGSFLKDPAFAALIAALRPERPVMTNSEPYGIAVGAALLCRDSTAAAPLDLQPARALPGLPDLIPYAARWRALSEGK